MANELPPRRTACDRCRSHKLRCRRDHGERDHGKCQRCLRAGTTCKTSAAARIGRPVGALQQHREQTRIQQREGACNESQMATPISVLTNEQTTPSDAITRGIYQPPLLTWSVPASQPSSNAVHTVSETASDNQTFQGQEKDSFDILDPSKLQGLPPPLDLRDTCVRKLADLHSSLVLDLSIVRDSQTADKCLGIINMPEFSQNYNFPIGRMLGSSASFVDILEYFVSSSKSKSQGDLVHCDIPTLHTIFTCYTYLIRIYRTVFTCIYKTVLKPPDPPAKLPPLFPGLQLGGYSLEPHFDLQVKIFIQVCEDMLAKIDTAIGLKKDDDDPENRGLLGRVRTPGELLHSMLEEERLEEHEEGIMAGNQKSLSEIIDCLKET